MSDERTNKEQQNGWVEWSKHIIEELKRLDRQVESIKNQINQTNLDVAKMVAIKEKLSAVEGQIKELKGEHSAIRSYTERALKDAEKSEKDNDEKQQGEIEGLKDRIVELEKMGTKGKWLVGILVAIITVLASILSFDVTALFGG